MSEFQPNTEGVFFDLAEDVYRAAPGVNISALKKMSKSPAHYRAGVDAERSEPTPAQVFGTMLHRAALEPWRLSESFSLKPDGIDYRSKDGKAWRDAQTLPILDAAQFKAVNGAADSVSDHPIAQRILLSAQKEVSVFKIHEPTGMLLKGRMDILATDSEGNTVIADVKTTTDASPNEFPREVAKWGYDQQAAFYLDLMGATFFMFLAVEKEAPYAVGIYNLDSDSIDIGRRKNERNLALLQACIESGIWPSYPQEITTISLPRWAKVQAGE